MNEQLRVFNRAATKAVKYAAIIVACSVVGYFTLVSLDLTAHPSLRTGQLYFVAYLDHYAKLIGFRGKEPNAAKPPITNTSSNEAKDQTFFNSADRNNIKAAVQHFVHTYKESGVTGVKAQLNSCYDATLLDTHDNLLYCRAFDTVATGLMSEMESKNNWPPTAEFQKEAYDKRVENNLVKDGIKDAARQVKMIIELQHEIHENIKNMAAAAHD